MGLSISTDLVLDVMRAAEPGKLAAARQRLGASGVTTIAKTAPAVNPEPAVSAARAKANQQFEAAMLRSFTEQMLPEKASSLYGEGTAATVWRSLQVDLMSQKLAEAGGIGIAKMLDESAARSEARAATAETLGLNEIFGGSSSKTPISSAAEWPYFQKADEGQG